jgi:uncharacterized protein
MTRKIVTEEIKPEEKTIKRGFAAMPIEKVRALGSMGGKAVQAAGKAHRWNKETGRAAGRLGGLAARTKRQSTAGEET